MIYLKEKDMFSEGDVVYYRSVAHGIYNKRDHFYSIGKIISKSSDGDEWYETEWTFPNSPNTANRVLTYPAESLILKSKADSNYDLDK